LEARTKSLNIVISGRLRKEDASSSKSMLLALEKKNLGLFANLQKGFLIMREVRFKRFIIRYKLVETAKLNINSDSMDVRATNKTSTA